MAKQTAVVIQDTFVRGKPTPAGTEFVFDDKEQNDAMALVGELHSAGRVALKGSPEHQAWLDSQPKTEKKADK